MAEIAFEKLQLGKQGTTPGTPVAATTVFPVNPGAAMVSLDRSLDSPDEDFGQLARHQPGRGSYGMRDAALTLPFEVRFEDVMHMLEMRMAGGVTPSGGGPFTWVYTNDLNSDTTRYYTMEAGSETSQDQWQATGCVIEDLEFSFADLAAAGNSPWLATANVVAINRAINPLTGSLSAPASMETIEGHLSIISEGTTGTAFAALAALSASLVSYKVKISGPRPQRAYGSGSDVGTAYGIKKRETTFEAAIKVSATAKTDLHDIFNAAGSPAGERRWRIAATGSGTKSWIIDGRVRFDAVNTYDRDGERTYMVAGQYVNDPTLASDLQITVVNGVGSLA